MHCGVGTGYPTATAVLPGSSPKDPDPPVRIGRRIPVQVPEYHRQRATGDRVRHSGGHSLARVRTSDDQRSPFCHHEQVRGCGPSSPLSSQWAAVPTRRDDAICHMSTLSAESPLQSQPYIPTLWIGRSLDVLIKATREDLIPWIGFALRARQDIRLTFLLFLSLSLSLSHSSAQLPLLLLFLLKAAVTFTGCQGAGSRLPSP